jgi:hypothetical protein
MSLLDRLARLLRRLAFRPYAPLGPLLLYLLIAVGMLYPFWPPIFRGAGDLFTAIGTIVEADNALREGQFPIRVAPTQIGGARYPFFQFYGNFPFTAAAIVRRVLPGHDPYLAWKVTTVLALTCGGFFTWRLCRRLTRRGLPAVLGGAIFMTAPYMFADFVGRGAFTELVAFNLLPAVMYFAHRAFASPGVGNICRSAIAWALLGMSHNITYLYGITFIGLWFLMYLLPLPRTRGRGRGRGAGVPGTSSRKPTACAPSDVRGAADAQGVALRLEGVSSPFSPALSHGYMGEGVRRCARRLSRVIVGGLIHGLLVAWYLAPQVMLMKSLKIGVQNADPSAWVYLTTLRSLLSPVAYTVPMTIDSVTPLLTTQVGVPVLVSVLLGLVTLFLPRLGWRRRATVMRGVVLFAAAFVLAWAPVDFWRWLPGVFRFVQFPYRLLMFVVLFGSIAGAGALAWLVGMRRRWGAVVAFVLIGASAASYFPAGGSYNGLAIDALVAAPRLSGLEDYQITTDAAAKTGFYYPGLNFAGPEFTGYTQDGIARRPAENIVPTPVGKPDALEVEGTLSTEQFAADKMVVILNDRRHEFPLNESRFTLRVPVADTFDGTPVRLIVSPERISGGYAAAHVHRVEFVGGDAGKTRAGQPTAGVPARAMRAQTTTGLRTRASATVSAPSVVTLPLLYYPGLLRVSVDGNPVTPGNVGRFVALPLETGQHNIDVEFTGVRWANAVSLVGWVGVITVPFIRRRQRRREAGAERAGKSKAMGARFNPLDALLGVGALVLGVVLVKGYPTVAKYFDGSIRVAATSDLSVDQAHLPAYAFDGDPETAWVAPPGSSPTLKVRPHKAARLRAIEFASRETALWECFRTVRVVLKRDGNVLLDRVVNMPEAASQPSVRIELGGQRADEVEMHFSDPVTTTRDGRTIDAGLVSPGYREIRLDWARK